jgi:PncC family amidohydrolase
MAEMGGADAAENAARTAAETLVQRLEAAGRTIVLAESCTAGLAADLIARIPGASAVLWGSFVCYTPAAKTRMLGIGGDLLEKYGAVSRETACAMAEGALERSGASLALAVTGLAGPGGDGSAVPVGTVWIAAAIRGKPAGAAVFRYGGDRNRVRLSAAAAALGEAVKLLDHAEDAKTP